MSLVLDITLAITKGNQMEMKHMKAYPIGDRTKRSLLKIVTTAGINIMKKAQFIYTNGWHRVYTKPGGQKIALEDFDALNPTNVKEIIRPRKGEIKRTGRIGHTKVSVDINTKSGPSILRIARPTTDNVGQSNRAEPPTIDTIIVYTD